MEDQYQQEQREKYEQVYKATVEVLGHYGFSISWDTENYRITVDGRMLDDVFPERKAAYKWALLLMMQKFHEMKSKYEQNIPPENPF